MTWELYEVWAERDDGPEELIETTKSLKEATQLAEKALEEGYIASVIYRETEDGVDEIERFELG
jgi:hypothetical protein